VGIPPEREREPTFEGRRRELKSLGDDARPDGSYVLGHSDRELERLNRQAQFVEPITRWEPPARLSFDVRSQPLPMQEWSFYRRVHPPHLDASFNVVGQIREKIAVLPETAQQVVGVVAECARAKVPFVARGSGTGLSGGALAHADGVLIVMSKMRRIIAIDPASQRAIVGRKSS